MTHPRRLILFLATVLLFCLCSPFYLLLNNMQSKYFPLFLNSLFKVQVSDDGGDLSNTNDLSSSSQTAFRPQTFLGQVTMATAPPPSPLLQPLQATVHQTSTVPLLSPANPSFSSTAETQDRRAFVLPMTHQPLCIQGACCTLLTRC